MVMLLCVRKQTTSRDLLHGFVECLESDYPEESEEHSVNGGEISGETCDCCVIRQNTDTHCVRRCLLSLEENGDVFVEIVKPFNGFRTDIRY